MKKCLAFTVALLSSLICWSGELRQTVEENWAKQERRLGREAGSPAALEAALRSAEVLLKNLREKVGLDVSKEEEQLLALIARTARIQGENLVVRMELYHQARWLRREAALRNPLFPSGPIAFLKRNRFVCQMLHEYLGYFYDYGKVRGGGGVWILEKPGRSFEARDLIQGRLPEGNYATLAVDFRGEEIYFAFAERAATKPDFRSDQRRSFHIYKMDARGRSIRPLTEGLEDDFDPCPLPDGGIAFISSRRGAFCRCNNPWEPIPTYTLHRMAADGTEIRTLSFHETNEWHPWVMNDGRIAYTRWDYVDRSAANFHGIWTSNADGSNPRSLFGNYTTRINACYQPRSIPGSDRIVFVAGAHHADVGGSLVLVDPNSVRLDPRTGEDDLSAIETLTPEVCFAEANGWPKSYFHSPWPLAEDFYLTSFSFDPLPGMSSGETKDTRTGLYYFDRWGGLELLYQDASISCMYPTPLAPRLKPAVTAASEAIAETVEAFAQTPLREDEGELMVGDVRRSLFAMPANREIVELRVFQVLPKTGSHIVNDPRIGYANAESARMLLGSAPVERDGSAYFRVPARKPIYFQAVDATGRAVQSMRSITYLQPRERRSCIGCHEGPNVSPEPGISLAARRPASQLQPGPDGSLPFSFPRLVQPVLDRRCTSCHHPSGTAMPSLAGERTKHFTIAYENLRPYSRWYEWGDKSISQIATRPGEIGADASPLTRILEDKNHHPLDIPEEDRRRIYLWLDANAPFYGAYSEAERLAQQAGAAIDPPAQQ